MLKLIIATTMTWLCIYSSMTNAHSAVGTQCMVVSAQHYATQVGFHILKQGGNAIDAAVAMGYTLAVVHPACGNIGGGGFMLIRFADGKVCLLNFREKAPKRANPSRYLDEKGQVIAGFLSTGHVSGGLSKPYMAVAVPGTVMGLNSALEKYGTMPLTEVMQPAIALAEHGYILRKGDIKFFNTAEQNFKTEPNVAAIFLKKGHVYQPGDRLVQKDLAHTLRQIAEHGTRVFYQGNIAKQIAVASKQRGGLITLQDLKNYRIKEQQPITCNYRGYQIFTTSPPGSGVTLCEALKILERYPLCRWRFHSAISTHYIAEAMRFAYADRNRYLGDPSLTKNPIDILLSPHYLNTVHQKIKPLRATPSTSYAFATPNTEGDNTTAYVVVDRENNAVSVTYTLNDYFGAKVIALNTGFFLNNEMADFTIKPGFSSKEKLYRSQANLITPGKHPLSAISPTIITKDNHLFLVIGTPGGITIPSQLLNVIINVIDYGMTIQAAENVPRFHLHWLPDLIYMEPFTFSLWTQKRLERMGYQLHFGSPYGTRRWGAVAGIMVDPCTHYLYGAMDYRSEMGTAIGE